ncbi:phage DNA methylase, partial [mine drainage metagenome]
MLRQLPCHVMLSGYPSALYEEGLAGWQRLELQVMNQGGVRTEKLWFNFTPDRVHWANYTGQNHTHRQCIRRKAENWGRRYQALPPGERLAVLSALRAARWTGAGTLPPEVAPSAAVRQAWTSSGSSPWARPYPARSASLSGVVS